MIDKELLDKCKKMTAEDSMMRSLGCALSKTDLMDAAYDANAGRKLTSFGTKGIAWITDENGDLQEGYKSEVKRPLLDFCRYECLKRGSCEKLRNGKHGAVTELYCLLG